MNKNKPALSKVEGLIPELRFPEFKNKGEWKQDELDNFCTKISSGRDKNVADGKFELYGSTGTIGKSQQASYDGDYILVARVGANAGLLNRIKGKFGVTDNTLVVDLKKDQIIDFIFYSLKNVRLNKLIFGSGQPLITGGQLKSLKLPFPKSQNEQQKIASCLSSLDEVIEAHSQKLELLKDHKKGLMQYLFPQEGEKMPKYRFKELQDDGNWEEKTIGEIYDFKTTNSFSREYLNYETGKVKNIHYGDIHTKFNTLFDIREEHVPFINQEVSIERIKKENYCIEGDIVFADASEDLNDVGKSIEIINLNNEKLMSGLHTLLARQRERKLAIGFGGYLFKCDWVRKQIQREAQGTKVLGISATRIKGVKILYPNNPKEQQKIASCLSSLDDLIKAQTEKIEQLKLHKKGLMQGLFPKMND